MAWINPLVAVLSLLPLASATQPPSSSSATAQPTAGDDSRANDIEVAVEAWGRGDFLEVRGLLEPIADRDALDNAQTRVTVLVLLADATLSDATLPRDERQARAIGYLDRLMDADPMWRLPRKVYSPELYNLYLDVRERRISETGSQCEADRLACLADADAVESKLRETERVLADLTDRYKNQEVAIGEKRSRALALFPLGISHFLNGDRALGAAFLATEAAFGLTGLTLLIVRNTRCQRTDGFRRGSLRCSPRDGQSESAAQRATIRARRAEEVMGFLFIGTLIFDVVLAQARFKAFEITGTRPRGELEADPRGVPRRPRQRRRATVRPTAGASPSRATLGVALDF